MLAVAPGRPRRWPSSWIFVFESTPRISAFPVSYPEERESGTSEPEDINLFLEELDSKARHVESHAAPAPPCESWSGFFIQGIGDRPTDPVVLHRWKNDGGSRSIKVDPARHTLVMRPVLRFSTREVKGLRNRKGTFFLGVTITAGTEPFVLLGLLRRHDGSYSEAVFVPQTEEQAWSAFAHTPGEQTEIIFYALNDSAQHHEPCRIR